MDRQDHNIIPLGTKEELVRLAALEPLDYARVRKDEAKRMGVSVRALDTQIKRACASNSDQSRMNLPEPEPWPHPVEGANLLDQVSAAFSRYLALMQRAADVLALWVIHTYLYASFEVTPRLAITSPERGCGKTTLLRVLHALVNRPLPAANITAPALFRTVEAMHPTLLVDEADTFLSQNEELRGVINAGHGHDGVVIRLVGDSHEPKAFNVFCPLAIAAIGDLPDTITDRSLRIVMRRRTPNEAIERLNRTARLQLGTLARMIRRWTDEHRDRLAEADPTIPECLFNRAADNWTPLLAIADLAGGDWPEHARHAAQLFAGARAAEPSLKEMLLADIESVFNAKGVDRIRSDELVAMLNNMEDRPWCEWRGGRPLTMPSLAKLLKPFGVAPRSIRFGSVETAKGYYLEAFVDVFERYLPQSGTPSQAAGSLDFPVTDRGISAVTSRAEASQHGEWGEDVTDWEPSVTDRHDRAGTVKPLKTKLCDGVTAPVGDAAKGNWRASVEGGRWKEEL